MTNWMVLRSELTPEQLNIIREGTSKNLLLTGSPGSGKTLVLVHRLHHFLFENKIPENKVCLFVYTKSLREYIKDGVNLLNIPDSCINSFDKWCYKFYSINIGHPPIANNRGWRLPDYKEIRNKILEYLEKSDCEKIYDCVLVDEGQDLDEVAFKIIRYISKHVTMCMDDKQQIYLSKMNRNIAEKIFGIKPNEIRNINDAWRCSPHIVKLAAAFIENDIEKRYFLNQNRRPLDEVQVPYIAYSQNYILTNAKMAELIKVRMGLNESIAVLVPKNNVMRAIGHSLNELGINVEFDGSIDFSSNKPKVMTYHKAKGLTFDSVFLPSLVNNNFHGFNDSGITKRLLFVGISRAIKWVYMDFTSGSQLADLNNLKELENTGNIKIERLSDPNQPELFSTADFVAKKVHNAPDDIEDII